MERIVVGTDLGPRSKGAVEMAARLAEATGATLHLTFACPPTPIAPVPEAMVIPDTRAVMKEVTATLHTLATDLRQRGLETEVHVCTQSAADALCDVAETVAADVIVVGNKRTSGAGRLLGSVPSKVVHRAPCNVLIARTA